MAYAKDQKAYNDLIEEILKSPIERDQFKKYIEKAMCAYVESKIDAQKTDKRKALVYRSKNLETGEMTATAIHVGDKENGFVIKQNVDDLLINYDPNSSREDKLAIVRAAMREFASKVAYVQTRERGENINFSGDNLTTFNDFHSAINYNLNNEDQLDIDSYRDSTLETATLLPTAVKRTTKEDALANRELLSLARNVKGLGKYGMHYGSIAKVSKMYQDWNRDNPDNQYAPQGVLRFALNNDGTIKNFKEIDEFAQGEIDSIDSNNKYTNEKNRESQKNYIKLGAKQIKLSIVMDAVLNGELSRITAEYTEQEIYQVLDEGLNAFEQIQQHQIRDFSNKADKLKLDNQALLPENGIETIKSDVSDMVKQADYLNIPLDEIDKDGKKVGTLSIRDYLTNFKDRLKNIIKNKEDKEKVKKIKEDTKEYDKLLKELEAQRKEMEELNKNVEELQKDNEKLDEYLKKAEEILEKQAKNEEERRKLEEAKKELEEKQKAKEEELRQKEEEQSKKEQELEDKEKNVSEYKKILDEDRKALEDRENELSQKEKELDDERNNVNDEKQNLEDERKNIESDKQNIEDEKHNLENEKVNIEEERKKLEEDKKRTEEKEKEVEEREKEVEEKERKVVEPPVEGPKYTGPTVFFVDKPVDRIIGNNDHSLTIYIKNNDDVLVKENEELKEQNQQLQEENSLLEKKVEYYAQKLDLSEQEAEELKQKLEQTAIENGADPNEVDVNVVVEEDEQVVDSPKEEKEQTIKITYPDGTVSVATIGEDGELKEEVNPVEREALINTCRDNTHAIVARLNDVKDRSKIRDDENIKWLLKSFDDPINRGVVTKEELEKIIDEEVYGSASKEKITQIVYAEIEENKTLTVKLKASRQKLEAIEMDNGIKNLSAVEEKMEIDGHMQESSRQAIKMMNTIIREKANEEPNKEGKNEYSI